MIGFNLKAAGYKNAAGSLISEDFVQGLWTEFYVPDDGETYYILRDDWQRSDWGYKPRSTIYNDTSGNIALPQTVQFSPFKAYDFVPMTERLQYFHLDLLRLANPSVDETTIRWQMQELYRQSVAFTDRHAWDTGDKLGDPTKNFRFYPTNKNPDNPKPCAWKCGISTGSNIIRLVRGTVNVFECMDPAAPLPDPEKLFRDPALCHWATVEEGHKETNPDTGVITAKLNWGEVIDGSWRRAWRTSAFPQLRNILNHKTGVPYMFMGLNGRTKIDMRLTLPTVPGQKIILYKSLR